MAKPIEFNFNPAVAKEYVKQWKLKLQADKKAEERMVKVVSDIETLCEIGFKQLKK